MQTELKPCPFCGNPPRLFGKKIREIDGETMEVMPERTEWEVVPFCKITCILGNAFSAAYRIHGAGGYKTPEAAIKAWNRRETMAGDQLMAQSIMGPEDETMAEILLFLNMWQDAHPDLMVALVPAKDRYQYEVIKSGRVDDQRDSGA